ncbi:benzoate-CoA ligase [Rhodococcus aetherivorans]|uniref:Benzoate-CoA ligase n=2 Tax=Nocardiaceae TaxID=85025 RepID=A0ABQ0YGL1_9NOCA|nr:fatty acyl-CoA synthetase [Rhodococcus aetherivorans]ETT28252.1 Long-chain-fatty-acid--CoA ligase [Rhodococcus rhodochrous ATCC 21198]MDV6295629.1 fatty acyl-CoA synthetase [Rhodococcus aetherivorans]NGP25562.1 long-chain-fatty-acid--CoA ligase [Rhodococcus aetherivorans]GES35641.1 benzoate-CoA ligase [Rhodococcus aetherivorans]
MPRAYSSGVIDASADQVWSVVKDFGRVDSFLPPVAHSELIDGATTQIGVVRRLALADGGATLDERLLDLDDRRRQLSYEFAGDNPFGARNYRATVRVSPIGEPEGAFVEWWADFEADPAEVDTLVGVFADGVFGSGIRSLRTMFADRNVVARARRHSVSDLLHRSAQRYPDKTAVVDGDRRFTFAEFDRVVTRFAGVLHAHGLAKGDRLALIARNSWQFGALAFGAARIGVVLVPINFMLNAEEIAFILGHSGANGVIVDDEFSAVADDAIAAAAPDLKLSAIIGPHGAETGAGWESVADWEAGEVPILPDVAVADDDPVRIMYTSGTESRPKGVLLSSRALISQYASCAIDGGMSHDDVEVHALPMYHCAQMDCFFSVDVYLGATSIILRGPDPTQILETIQRERVTKLFCPPTVWISLLGHPHFDDYDLSSLHKGYYGAAPMPAEVLRELTTRLPQVRLWNFYGQTEMSPIATILAPEDQLTRAGSAGRPALNVETRIVDDAGQPLPPGEVGEIVHRSPHLTLGYYNDPAKTAESFAGGWFHSGDLGVIDEDGYLTIVDRKKDMIKTGGENVASREVEEALYLLDGVAEVAVFGVSHPYWIEAVTAVVVPRSGVDLTEDDIKAHARDKLAGYKQPKYVVVTDALPKNPSGKILKRQLRERYDHLSKEMSR